MPRAASRLPTHWMKAIFLTSPPSEGRCTWPPVGPAAESIRSNCTLESTLAYRPWPNSPRSEAWNSSKPGVRITLPTSICTSVGCWSWQIAPAEQALTHCMHSLQRPQARQRLASAMACSTL